MTLRTLILSAAGLALAACGQAVETDLKDTAAKMPVVEKIATVSLDDILAAQPDEVKARYQYRNPKQTLEFFGIAPGMTVAEVLPGGGWYSKLILPVLGDEGKLIGVDYSLKMWPEFGGFANAEFLEKKKSWPAEWMAGVGEWRGENTADLAAFAFGSRPADLNGTADTVLFIRALHNLSRFDDKGGYMSEAIQDAHALLKIGGVLGVVQHRGPEDADADWAKGQNGYLKQSDVIRIVEAAGFELAAKSEINANPKDQPGADDIVWRLPPTLGTSSKDEELKAKMKAIGESDRMTLKFVKK